jgi:HNH endonuclease
MDPSLAREVRGRARNFCEYCRVPQSCYPTVPFPIDHIMARQHGGSTSINNLDLSCLHDNTHKGPNIAGLDPQTRRITWLFNPRKDKWERHFAWDGPFLVGRTAVGRTTIVVLAMNHPDAVAVRRSLIAEGDSQQTHDRSTTHYLSLGGTSDSDFRLSLGSWLLASQDRAQIPLQRLEKGILPQWASGILVGMKDLQILLLNDSGQESTPVGLELKQGADTNQIVVLAAQVRRGAAPVMLSRRADQSRTHRVEFDVTRIGKQVCLVEHERCESPLP